MIGVTLALEFGWTPETVSRLTLQQLDGYMDRLAKVRSK